MYVDNSVVAAIPFKISSSTTDEMANRD